MLRGWAAHTLETASPLSLRLCQAQRYKRLCFFLNTNEPIPPLERRNRKISTDGTCQARPSKPIRPRRPDQNPTASRRLLACVSMLHAVCVYIVRRTAPRAPRYAPPIEHHTAVCRSAAKPTAVASYLTISPSLSLFRPLLHLYPFCLLKLATNFRPKKRQSTHGFFFYEKKTNTKHEMRTMYLEKQQQWRLFHPTCISPGVARRRAKIYLRLPSTL